MSVWISHVWIPEPITVAARSHAWTVFCVRPRANKGLQNHWWANEAILTVASGYDDDVTVCVANRPQRTLVTHVGCTVRHAGEQVVWTNVKTGGGLVMREVTQEVCSMSGSRRGHYEKYNLLLRDVVRVKWRKNVRGCTILNFHRTTWRHIREHTGTWRHRSVRSSAPTVTLSAGRGSPSLGLLFEYEDGGGKFLWNAELLANCTASLPREVGDENRDHHLEA
jgi:hypothetical protein